MAKESYNLINFWFLAILQIILNPKKYFKKSRIDFFYLNFQEQFPVKTLDIMLEEEE